MHPRLTRTRRRALAVPFVITIAATGAGCGATSVDQPAGDRTPTSEDVVSNPAEPAPDEQVVSNPAEPAPDEQVVSNPAEPPPDDIVVSNPAPPEDG